MKNYILILLTGFLLSCQSHEVINPENKNIPVCGVSNPQELPWLKAWLQKTEVSTDNPCALWQVTQGIYQGQTVYVITVGGPLCCTCAGNVVYNCEGEQVFVCDLEQEAKITDKEVIWERK